MTAQPRLSAHFAARNPSSIRLAQIEFAKRGGGVKAINVAIGNVSLPMHPAMTARLASLAVPGGPLAGGVLRYTASVGTDECRGAFLHLLASSGLATEGLNVQITDGGSAAMELVLLGVCGPAGSGSQPLLVIDPLYTNYLAFAERLGRRVVAVRRRLDAGGGFALPSEDELEQVIRRENPAALLVIPYDNPTGQLFDRATMNALGRLCVKHNLWLVSDEAYRELNYTSEPTPSVWAVTEAQVPGITGRRISIESASKVWNACGLRIGALITDNAEFHRRSVAESTASLCANAIGQQVFAALGQVPHAELQQWYGHQREYYRQQMTQLSTDLRALLPGIIVSSPLASIYTVVDLRDLVKPGFEGLDFVMYCAREGQVLVGGQPYTLLTAPLTGFYQVAPGQADPGATQLRIAFVGTPEESRLIPGLLARLLRDFEAGRKSAC
jgi:aspartate aminotransferase